MFFGTCRTSAALTCLAGATCVAVADNPYVESDAVKWKSPSEHYAGTAFAKAFRYKTLIGGQSAPVHGRNVLFVEAEFAPGAIYVGHNHPAPEIYYIISGEAEWTVGNKTFKATPGMAIYTKPHAVHRMVNTGDGVLKTIWMWWGDPTTTNHLPTLTERPAKQPPRARFAD